MSLLSATLDAIDTALAGQDGPCAEAEVGVDDSGLEDEHYGYHGEDEADNVWDGGEDTDGYYPDGEAAFEQQLSGQGSAYDALLAALDNAIAMHDDAGTDMQHGVDDGGYEDGAQAWVSGMAKTHSGLGARQELKVAISDDEGKC